MKIALHTAAQKLERSIKLLEYRRINWAIAQDVISKEFQDFLEISKSVGLPFPFYVRHDDEPNENVFGIYCGRTYTGAVDRKLACPLSRSPYSDSPVFETEGTLIASQDVEGFINFIVYPRKSDRLSPIKNELLILASVEPTKVTPQLIRWAIRRYLLLLQDSSVLGSADALTRREHLMVWWLYFRELRGRHELYRSMLSLKNEWGKIIVAALLAFAVGYFL